MRARIIIFFIFMAFAFSQVFAQNFESVERKFDLPRGKIFRLLLDVEAGRLNLKKNERSTELKMTGQIYRKIDELEIDFDKKHNELSIFLNHQKWFKSAKDDISSKITIFLPENIITELSSEIKAGKIDFRIGGLSLKSFELQTTAGEVEIDFDEPNLIPMEYLDIDVKIGSADLRRLGNARFQDGRINGGIGELNIDLRGQGSKNAHLDIDLDMGSTKIILPGDQGVKLRSTTFGFLTSRNISHKFEKRGRYYYSRDFEKSSRKLSLVIHSGIGSLDVYFR